MFKPVFRASAAAFSSASDRRLGGCGMAGWAAVLVVAVRASFFALIPASVALAWASSSAVTVPGIALETGPPRPSAAVRLFPSRPLCEDRSSMVGAQPPLTFIVYLLPPAHDGAFPSPLPRRGLLSVRACKRPFHRHFLHFSERAKHPLRTLKKTRLVPIPSGFVRLHG